MYGLREPFIYMYFLKYNYQNGELKKWRSYDIKWSLHRLPWWLSGEESVCECRRHRFDPWVRKIPQRRKWQLTPVFLPGKCHGQRSWVGYSPWDPKSIGHGLVTKQQRVIKPFKHRVHVCSVTSDSATPWTVAHQAPLSVVIRRQEYWSGLPCLPPGDLSDPGIKPESFGSPELVGKIFFLITEPPGKPI